MHIMVRSVLEQSIGIGCRPFCKCAKRKGHEVCRCKCGQEWDKPE
jgi:hypothetical protein